MLSELKEKTTSGMAVLFLGLILLIFTFINAYIFLSENLQIITSNDIAKTFGDSLSPLVSTAIRVMYLGVMGWIGSIITIRGVTIMSNSSEKKRKITEQQK